MSVGSIGPSGTLPPPSALAGMQQAQGAMVAASEQVAAGNIDPAVIVDVVNAETSFAANAKVLQSGADMTKKLLDVLA